MTLQADIEFASKVVLAKKRDVKAKTKVPAGNFS